MSEKSRTYKIILAGASVLLLVLVAVFTALVIRYRRLSLEDGDDAEGGGEEKKDRVRFEGYF